MMIRNILVCLPFLLVVSCNRLKEKEEPPIPSAKMEQLVMDLHLAEVYSSITRDSSHNVTIKNLDSLALYHREILAHHNLTLEQLNKITDWYKYHPQELDSVYAHIIPRMTEMEASLVK